MASTKKVLSTIDRQTTGALMLQWLIDQGFRADGVSFNLADQLDIGMDFTDASGTPGAATINKPAGVVAIAAGASSVVVTNSLVQAGTIIVATLQTTDGTATFVRAVIPTTGSFTINVNANATGNTKVAWAILGNHV